MLSNKNYLSTKILLTLHIVQISLKDNRSGDDKAILINKGQALEKNNDGNLNNIATNMNFMNPNSINKNINGGYNIGIGQYSLESSFIAASQSNAMGYNIDKISNIFNNGLNCQ